MEHSKQHSLFRLIHSMDPTEKAYFKKFAFKRDNKNNDSYIAIFNLIDKQQEFDIKALVSNRKINEILRSNMHAALNKLFNIITQLMIEYRKDKSSNNKLFGMLDEFEFLREKKLFDLAEKKYTQIEAFVEEKKMYYFKPYVYQIRGIQLRNSILSKPKELKIYFDKLDESKQELDVNIEVSKIGLKIEEMFHRNGGIVNKDKSIQKEADQLIAQIDDVMAISQNNFLFISVLANNRFIIQMMFGRMANLSQYMRDYLAYFDENIEGIQKDTVLHDIVITLKNYAAVCVYLNMHEIYNEVLNRLSLIFIKLKDKEYKKQLNCRILQLKTLNFALNEGKEMNEETINDTIASMESFVGKSQYSEALLSCMMALIKLKKFDSALDISEKFIREHHNERIRDQYISIRLVRAIAWFKKDEYALFESEINSVYRKLLNIENFPFQLHITQMLKRLNKLSAKEKNNDLIEAVVKECDEVLETEVGSKMMKAVELKAIALLALT